jgi:hypothetical protein
MNNSVHDPSPRAPEEPLLPTPFPFLARPPASDGSANVDAEARDSSSLTLKRTPTLNLYAMPGEDDYFLNHPNTVLLGFLGTVASILLVIILIVWLGSTIFWFAHGGLPGLLCTSD